MANYHIISKGEKEKREEILPYLSKKITVIPNECYLNPLNPSSRYYNENKKKNNVISNNI